MGNETYRLVHPVSADLLIDEEEFARDERLPYWAVIWPSSIALARRLSFSNLRSKRIMELGCGLGLPSMVALRLGARVTAVDHYEIALDFARWNARANTGQELKTAHLDWHSPAAPNLGRFEVVLAADVLYEQRNVPALAALIPELLSPKGEVLVSNPRRRDAPDFHEAMGERGFGRSTESATVRQGERDVEVLIHRFRRTC
ncbi:MAG: methyltransferase [Rubrobacteraceae bacterium]